jgi:hypothetical protein
MFSKRTFENERIAQSVKGKIQIVYYTSSVLNRVVNINCFNATKIDKIFIADKSRKFLQQILSKKL